MQVSDNEMRAILRDASREAERLIARQGVGIGGKARTAQLGLARIQRELWATVHSQVKVGIGDGADAAAESSSYLNELMFNEVGATTSWWRQSLLAQARAGIPNLISRKENGITLSQRVYRTSVGSTGVLQKMINGMITNGASAREIATRARDFISPDVPGGASYAAMRLGRTELNNAFHQTSVRIGASQPWVIGQKWNISSSHPKPDECDEYAAHDEGKGRGVFGPTSVPGKPHPQCFCFITAVTPSREEFVKNFHSGKYDEHLNSMGCGVA